MSPQSLLTPDKTRKRRTLEAAVLYESPFTDRTPRGPDGLFARPQVDAMLEVLRGVRATAVV